MTWAIQVEGLAKRYRLGASVTPAAETLVQDVGRRVVAAARTLAGRGGAAGAAEAAEAGSLVLAPSQLAGCPPGHFWALRDVGFEVAAGDRVGIVGRNGSGKSTLLKILSRITTPHHGRFRFRGRLISLLEVGAGFHADLTGRENIFMNAQLNGMSARDVRQILDSVIDFSELGMQIDTPVKRYSSGMYMRLAFAVAAHLESEILIVDEVLAVGDARFQKKCLDKMLEISGGGRTLLFVSHDMGAVATLCTKALELQHGQVIGGGLRSVHDAISDYMLDGDVRPQQRWDDDNRAHHMLDQSATLRGVAVRDAQGAVRGKFDVTDAVAIELEYEVHAERHCFVAGVFVSTLTGQRLFASMNNLDVPDAPRAPGLHRETCVIPRDFLNEGTYVVEARLATHPYSDNNIGMPNAVSFAVGDARRPGGVRGTWTRDWPDYPLRPRLAWKAEQPSVSR